ncbi:MAG: hypothetical protein K9W45_04005 [Candidatus Heimdallarchaeum aukensis]|uniref:Winged helix-turn-helix domain-containing protein n=1 Tax=Candidatus Heimdallarchaeum aukensis TaxID=2876573 RepID=A0A9Y1BMB2_9ARCH|nr:MAG: hypothetical protein K9W45_04005 [Candidatus Heimdallarchaeum aukensis]
MSEEKYDYRTALKKLKEKMGGTKAELLERNKQRNKDKKLVVQAIKEGLSTVPKVAEKTGLPTDRVFSIINQLVKYEGLVMKDKRSEYPVYGFVEEGEKDE